MKMSINEFINRQDEFEGYKVRFKVKMKSGNINYFERLVNDEFCNPNGEMFEVLEVEILEYVGIISLFK
ncbi:hypothetical protein [Robertmurraya siralis]|uniref:hypothetical protein n=1 Tax=Robertmurraya siralis TaxID=77777 RepID=UPI0010F5E3C8|nr:hypothetical protein [Robertmurraya siralis]